MSSAICFDTELSKNLSSGKGLNLNRTIPNFNNSWEGGFWKHFGKRRKCWLPAFSPFPKMISILSETNFILTSHIFFSCAKALNLDQSKILSFGKELKRYNPGNQHFPLFPTILSFIPRTKSNLKWHLFCFLKCFSIRSSTEFCHVLKSKMMEFGFDRTEKIKKRRKCNLEAIPPFPQCFQKVFITWY